MAAVLAAFGRNEHTRKVFWVLRVIKPETGEEPQDLRLLAALAGLVLAQVLDPVTAETVLTGLTGI